MKYILLAFLLVGCSTDTSPIDLSWLYTQQECTCEEPSVDGYLTDLVDQIDVNTVKLNHYVDEVKIEENYAELIDINGSVSTKNHIELPPYIGTPMKHTLIVEFIQIR